MQRELLSIALTAITLLAAGTTHARATPEVLLSSEVQFQPLNPARGDAAPKAGALWGDLRKDVPTGALIVFADGFASPPHIHNITYRGVVISGRVHNDDPTAENLWMGPGSFWTQPAGESHITAAAPGGQATAFLEILQGPYLVQPADEAFDNGERPVNLEAGNIVWLDESDVTWVSPAGNAASAHEAEMAFLWGGTQATARNGSLLKLPAGFNGELRGNDAWLRAVVIRGKLRHQLVGQTDETELNPGSYFGADSKTAHNITCEAQEECLVYVSTAGKYEFSGT